MFSAATDGTGNDTFSPLVQDFPSATGDIEDFEISADGSHEIYTADQRIDSIQELFSVPVTGGFARRLSGDQVSSDDVDEFKTSPMSDRVLFTADANSNGAEALFTVPMSGSSLDVRSIENNRNSEDEVVDFVISGDGRNVIFEKRFDIDGTIQLTLAPTDAGRSPTPFSPILGDPNENEEGEFSILVNGEFGLHSA